MKETLLNILKMDDKERQQYMDENGDQLLSNMVQHIGYPEDELRDKLNYRVFIELLSQNQLSSQQMTTLIKKLIEKNYLYFSIGEKDSDTVFTRSFSALWLTALLYADKQLHYLSLEESIQILEASSPYLGREKDVRGYVIEKGWALAIAHGADLATAIIAHPAFEMRLAPSLLQGIKNSFWIGSVYTNDEDERLVQVIEQLINKNYPEEILIEWIEQVFDKLQFYLMEEGYTPLYFTARSNTLHFMKTLYFILKFSQKTPELKGTVSLFIGKWMKQL